jgi:hypothetical protein
MLPGFRFFVATIVLAASVLIFGLGAAALLRATHEEVATAPALRAMQPMMPPRPQKAEAAPPTLAMLRIEIPSPAAIEELPAPAETVTVAPAETPEPPEETAAAIEAPEPVPAPESAEISPASVEPAKPATAEETSPSTADATPTASDVTVAAVPSSTPEPAPPPQAAAPAPQPAPVSVEAETETKTEIKAETAPQPVSPQPAPSPAEATPTAAAEPPPATEAKAPANAPAEAAAPAPTPAPPTPIAVGGAPVVAAPPAAATPEPTRVVAVTATGCEILPTAPSQPGLIPEAARTAPPGAPVPADRTAKLETMPAATVPLPEARPDREARTAKRRSATVRHRRRAPHVRQARREIVRPQPPPDLFTILFGGGIQQQPQQVPVSR